MEPIGYIYIRTNKYWDIDEVCKFGETDNIPNRESIYITSEPKRGKFIVVIQINSLSPSLKIIESELKKYFTSLGFHRYIDGGTEFFKKDIVEHLFSWFEKSTIQYKILTDEEIDALTYNKTSSQTSTSPDIAEQEVASDYTSSQTIAVYSPRDYQLEIIEKSCDYLKTNDKGLLIMPCGIGKTLLSLWIAQKLIMKTILIGVPNILLLAQWYSVISKLFPTSPHLQVYDRTRIDQPN